MAFGPINVKDVSRRALAQGLESFSDVNRMDDFAVQRDPQFDYLKQAEQMAFKADQVRQELLAQTLKNSAMALQNRYTRQANNAPALQLNVRRGQQGGGGNGVGAMPSPPGRFGNFIDAISGQESGNSYGIRNNTSGAMGKYQIMPANITGTGSGWDWEALGRDVSVGGFMSHPKIQEAIARYKLKQYYNQYGAAGAASAWYSGSASNWNSRDSQGNYPSIHDYVLQILARMRG